MAQKELGTCLGHIIGKLYEYGETVKAGPSKGATCIILSRIITSLLRSGVRPDTIDLAVSIGKDDYLNADDEDDGDEDDRDDPSPDDEDNTENPQNVPVRSSFRMD